MVKSSQHGLNDAATTLGSIVVQKNSIYPYAVGIGFTVVFVFSQLVLI